MVKLTHSVRELKANKHKSYDIWRRLQLTHLKLWQISRSFHPEATSSHLALFRQELAQSSFEISSRSARKSCCLSLTAHWERVSSIFFLSFFFVDISSKHLKICSLLHSIHSLNSPLFYSRKRHTENINFFFSLFFAFCSFDTAARRRGLKNFLEFLFFCIFLFFHTRLHTENFFALMYAVDFPFSLSSLSIRFQQRSSSCEAHCDDTARLRPMMSCHFSLFSPPRYCSPSLLVQFSVHAAPHPDSINKLIVSRPQQYCSRESIVIAKWNVCMNSFFIMNRFHLFFSLLVSSPFVDAVNVRWAERMWKKEERRGEKGKIK